MFFVRFFSFLYNIFGVLMLLLYSVYNYKTYT